MFFPPAYQLTLQTVPVPSDVFCAVIGTDHQARLLYLAS